MLALDPPRVKRRRPSLTPMIDVVFLLLVFFMLASQFGRDGALTLATASGGGDYAGPPRLVSIAPDHVTLNGVVTHEDKLASALAPLMAAPEDIVVLRAGPETSLQRLIEIAQTLRDAGITSLAVVE